MAEPTLTIRSILALCASLGAGWILSACTTTVRHTVPVDLAAELNRKALTADYRISTGDELDLRFFYTPELNSTVVVRPDGKVNLPLVGEIRAAGRIPGQLSDDLKIAYARDLKNPDISVNVRGFASHRVFVGGEVLRAGVQPLIGSMSALQAIMMSEGLRETAAKSALVIRRGANGARTTFTINLDKALSGTDPEQDILLEPFDLVVVPRSGIANVNSWVDMYIRRNLPINFGYGYTINDNRNDSGLRQ